MEHSIYGYLIFYLVFSALTGSIMYAVWLVMERAFRKYLSARFSVAALEVCLVCFLVPVIYFRRIYQFWKYGYDVEIISFHTAPELDVLFRILAMIWIGGFLVLFLIYLQTKFRLEARLKMESAPMTDERALAVLRECCEKFGIRQNIKLFCCAQNGTALVYGLRDVHVVVSEETCRDEDSLRIVLTHELMHISRYDILIKHLGVLIRCLYWFHPLAHLILGRLSVYLEYRCDELCCSETIGGVGRTNYFNVILNFAEKKKRNVFFVYAGFSVTWEQLRRRIEYMSEKKKLSGVKKICVVLAVVLAANAGLVTAYAASDSLAWGNYDVNDTVVDQIDVNKETFENEMEIIEEEAGEDDPDITEIDITDEVMKNRSTSFSVELPPMSRKTVQIYMVKGDVLSVKAIIVPSTKTARAGIIRPNNSKAYVSGKGAIAGSFTAAVSDYHKLYVENPNRTGVIKVTVNYSVK